MSYLQEQGPSQLWIIGVVGPILGFVMLLVLYHACRRRVYYTRHRNPSRIESGFNRDCTNIFQQSHVQL